MKKIAAELLKIASEITLGEAGTEKSWQAAFPAHTKCQHCGSDRCFLIVNYYEGHGSKEFLCKMHHNDASDPHGEGYWPHDAVAIAVYFCRDCAECSTLWNQA